VLIIIQAPRTLLDLQFRWTGHAGERQPTRTMNKASKISVAMCTCNGETYLQEQLETILAQTMRPDELIVCDDASTDRTVEILNTFKGQCNFPVNIIVNKNRVGVCKNFENAIAHCSGDIIVLSDQDDIWLPSKIAALMATFESDPRCGYVFSNADLIDERGSYLGRDLWTSIGFDKKQQARYAVGHQLDIMLRRFTLSYGMTMAFRGAFKAKLLPFGCQFPQAIVHDGWISLMLTSIGAHGIAIPSCLVKYRQHDKQLASAGHPLKLTELVKEKRSRMTQKYLLHADFLVYLAERLRDQEPRLEAAVGARNQMIEKAVHLRARVQANSSHGFQRIKTVLLESVSGRYGRYSRSVKSIVKDLISE
jgi:glycosyltransferase involved in cell wall biosynthesis